MKPILFNTDMVRAILEGRKTVTRQVVKGYALEHLEIDTDGSIIGVYDQHEGCVRPVMDFAPYHPADTLYVRETWAKRASDRCNLAETGRCPFETCETAPGPCFSEEYIYKATDSLPTYGGKWRPSIHMPKEAARLFLRVTSVRVERVQEITSQGAFDEGAVRKPHYMRYGGERCLALHERYKQDFATLWDTTIKPADLPLYGWDANPWVWVIEFERITKEEALEGGKDRA